MSTLKRRRYESPISHSRSSNELVQYLNSPRVENVPNFDVCAWWSQKDLKYSKRIAKDYLRITPSSVPSEQKFSAAGLTVTKERTSLNIKSVKNLICLTSWINKF